MEKLVRICELGMLAPSACNSQPWKLHIINKESKNLDAVRKACQVVGLNKFLNDVNSYIVIEQVFGNRSASLGSHFGNNDLNSLYSYQYDPLYNECLFFILSTFSFLNKF